MHMKKKPVSSWLSLVLLVAKLTAAGRVFASTELLQAPAHLRCEYLDNPLGVDTPHPRFFWWIEQDGRGRSPSAYQILVAVKPRCVNPEQGRCLGQWQGAVGEHGADCLCGQGARDRKRYYWKVRYWDQNGTESLYSVVAHFSVGILSRSEWKASWIGGGVTNGNEFRKAFVLDGKVARAQVYVTALGYYDLHINGKRVGTKVLDPAWTTYPKRILYSTYDVTNDLRSGENAIGAMLGGGWALERPINAYRTVLQGAGAFAGLADRDGRWQNDHSGE